MRFSSRTPDRYAPNLYTETLARLKASGEPVFDLTISNPTRAGISYPTEQILEALTDPRATRYEPDARGLLAAREAVARWYALRGVAVDPARIVLAASTSEAYAYLFKLLCEPGDDVLVPTPSYPLFEHLARSEAVAPVSYALELAGRWRLDAEAVREAASPRSRAVVVVSPNNPTGSALRRDELDALVAVARERDLAVVCDEVFSDYLVVRDDRIVSSVASESRVLTFTLNGLSKAAGLPQLKLGWIVVNGPDEDVAEALARLEFVADLFLSVATPVQLALPRLLALAPEIREQIAVRVLTNLDWAVARIGRGGACEVMPLDGGWYATIRVPRLMSDEELVVSLLERERVAVQPGYFFDHERDGLVVVSLLTPPDVFAEGVERLLAFVERACARVT
jgi:aspartate/methionine/tyrosine aminotransferase